MMTGKIESDGLETRRGGFGGAVLRLAERARLAIDDMRERHALRRDLAACEAQGQLDATLEEAGLSRNQLGALVQGSPRSGRLLAGMAGWLGVDLGRVPDPMTVRELQRVCSLCTAQRQCQHWLRHPDGRGYRAFCPNAELLDELRHARGHG